MTFGGKKLNKTDRKHLRENKIYTKYQFLEQVDFLKQEKKKGSDEGRILCHDCLHIARKLGLWGES